MFLFTTYFDQNYLSRGLVLYRSLLKHCNEFNIYVLCLDNFTFEYFLNNSDKYPEIIALSINEIESYDIELKESKNNRSTIEYYFTLSPCLPLFLLKKYNLPHICSLDADIMFFSSPEEVFSLLKKYSVLITPHNFSPKLKYREIYGKFNVSFQIFKNDQNGLKCLESWRKQCIAWCYDKLENGKFADQKYLDDWQSNFSGVSSIEFPGIGVAPWNISSYTIDFYNNQLYVNNDRLIFYHYHGLRIIGQNLIIHGLTDYSEKVNKMICKFIYKPYIKNLLSYTRTDDSEIQRLGSNSQSVLKTILFQKDWLYYRSGILFRKIRLLEILGTSIIYVKQKIERWRN